MFSGIKYILGYTDETDSVTSSTHDAVSGSEQITNDLSSKSPDTSSTNALEQTLNAATTKFTEQLLPQQASIEQLQSSSHQLLPSIIEQHEEDEVKKISSEIAPQAGDVGEEDDDINVDSWELLDLIDKVDGNVGAQSSLITSSVQKDESPVTQGISKSTSGILKSSGSKTNNDTNDNLQLRQKQKVSFETPDLVKFKQEIEQTKPKEEKEAATIVAEQAIEAVETDSLAATSVAKGSKRSKNNRKAKNSKAHGAGAASKKQDISNKSEVEVAVVVEDKKESVDKDVCRQNVMEDKSNNPSRFNSCGEEQQKQLVSESKSSTAKQVPVLNYAKALSTKPKAKVIDVDAGNKKNDAGARETEQKNYTDSLVGTSDQNGPVKRSRPLSTSSWSSSDDIEALEHSNTMEAAAEASSSVVAGPSLQERKPDVDLMDDNESIISSGFSDCDYGFSGVNDYIMRPKKAYSKRGHQSSSGSSSSLVGMKSRRSDGMINSNKMKQSGVAPKGTKSVAAPDTKTVAQSFSSSKSNKPKKKRMIMATSKIVGPSDFLKQKRNDTKTKPNASKQAMPNGSSESSDIAEMDESWFVTPPPCFTGAKQVAQSSNQVDQPKAKEAARENALIEHPSVYIASTSKDSLKVKFTAKPKEQKQQQKRTQTKTMVQEPLMPAQFVSKEAAIFEDSAWDSDEEDLSDVLSLGKPADLVDDYKDHVEPTSSFDQVSIPVQGKLTGSAEGASTNVENKPPLGYPTLDVKNNTVVTLVRRGPENVRPPTQVRPIEPERRPGWQLKRQRSKRRSSLKTVAASASKQAVGEPKPSPVSDRSASSSVASSSRSTPTLIDRIGTSIVANLTNLTNGLVSSGAMNYCPNGRHPNMMEANPERAHQSPLVNKTNSNANIGQLGRKQMSRGFLKRQNNCAKQGNSLRRPDRRLKMFAIANGCSVNRKVHTSIH